MKLKRNFMIHKFSDAIVAVGAGEQTDLFYGMIRLNETGAFVLELLKEDITIQGIIAEVIKHYKVTEKEALESVEKYIEYLKKYDLIQEEEQ